MELNASLLDEGTSAAEALSMLQTRSREKIKNVCNKFFIDESTFSKQLMLLKQELNHLELKLLLAIQLIMF